MIDSYRKGTRVVPPVSSSYIKFIIIIICFSSLILRGGSSFSDGQAGEIKAVQ